MIDLYPLVGSLLTLVSSETAHRLAIRALQAGLVPAPRHRDDPILATSVWGRNFPNPIGLAAGFDKNAEVADAMLAQGCGFVEVGSVTPRPQSGNPPPRLFRLPEDQAIINRLGFNNDGLPAMVQRLAGRPRAGLLGVNLGKNADTADAAADYAKGAAALGGLADYLVINVSSPNTLGLRALQGREALTALIERTRQALAELPAAPPLLLKIAPDLTDDDLRDIAEIALAAPLDGLIVCNTTVARPLDMNSPHRGETGGLSGQPLYAASTLILHQVYRLTAGRIPLIGVGGVGSAAQAYAKIRAGASLVQLYTALVYRGPGLVRRIKRGLADYLRRDGFASVADAVGADHASVP